MTATPEMVMDAKDIVGESLVYDDRQNALVWVDIGGKRIHRLWLATSRHEIWPTPDFVTCIGLRQDGGAIVGLTQRIVLWDFGGSFQTFAFPEPDLPGNRLNEGRVAPDGSFWVGTMQNNLNEDGSPREMDRACGAIYRIASDGGVQQLTPREYGISNTMAWTSDGRFLFADTVKNEIYGFDLRAGKLANRRLFAQPLARGLPDGSAMDEVGCLWNCRVVGGSGIACFRPDGVLERIVDVPCSWPTSCTFGGPELATLYVTSARFTMPPRHLAENPWEGGLFSLDVSRRGRPENRFG